MKIILILGLLLILSIGCVGESQQSTSKITSPPPEKSNLEGGSPSKTFDTNPKYKVLIPGDIEDFQYFEVITSEYDNLKIALEEDISKEEYRSLKESGFLESYEVDYRLSTEGEEIWENDTRSFKIITFSNIMSRYKDKESLDKRLDYFESEVEKSEDVTIMAGKEFGDQALYQAENFSWSGYTIDEFRADVLIENYKINLHITGERSAGIELSDLYPYLEILINRVKSDEEVRPPEVT